VKTAAAGFESDRCHKAQVPREVRNECAPPIRGSRWRRYFDIFFFFAFFVAMAYFLLV
jgi:hypothetical protein